MESITDIIKTEIDNGFENSFGLETRDAIQRLKILPQIFNEDETDKYINYWESVRKNCCTGYALKCAKDLIDAHIDNYEVYSKWSEAYHSAIANSKCTSCILQYLKR